LGVLGEMAVVAMTVVVVVVVVTVVGVVEDPRQRPGLGAVLERRGRGGGRADIEKCKVLLQSLQGQGQGAAQSSGLGSQVPPGCHGTRQLREGRAELFRALCGFVCAGP
jgi:hypothetical protein